MCFQLTMPRTSQTSKASNVSRTMTFPIAYYAMWEQIKQKQGLESYEQVIMVATSKLFTQLGMGEMP